MNTKNIIQQIVNIGIPINVIARRVGKDGSTIAKWLRGRTNISQELDFELKKTAIQMNKEWQQIFIGVIPHSADDGGGIYE